MIITLKSEDVRQLRPHWFEGRLRLIEIQLANADVVLLDPQFIERMNTLFGELYNRPKRT